MHLYVNGKHPRTGTIITTIAENLSQQGICGVCREPYASKGFLKTSDERAIIMSAKELKDDWIQEAEPDMKITVQRKI